MALIELHNISKTYDTGAVQVKALDQVNFRVEENEYLALTGASGSGKSTLMNILGCLDQPTKGQYLLNNQDVSRLTDEQLAAIRNSQIGFVFQTFNLIARMNALENVAMPLIYSSIDTETRTHRAKNMLEQVGLADRITHKPEELSGGQKQRVAIARALINNPSLILADEPTGNLDSQTTAEIMELFDNLHKQGNTIIIITHEDEIAHRTNRIIHLKDGAITHDKEASPKQKL